ncbi:Hypothetical protein R9X50_00351100 [Acrodontium crateriforme]|uniref:Uncharacterized protein n=1 Tax=Acrodontium crateriforme TaxID=150365 RepID=A0AAQ3R4A5_9PEZI|nr:Hypothetical protein R9X50_00351100 [Acrodontium crateriforme]
MVKRMISSSSTRCRIREAIPGIHLGLFHPGKLNSITDVPGVLVNTHSIIKPKTEKHHEVNTGVTAILPRSDCWKSACYAGIHRFNGAGEMTGSHMIAETGLLASPIIITNTFSVGAGHEGAIRHLLRNTRDANGLSQFFALPVIAETSDAFLNDISTLAVRPEHVIQSIDAANSDPVPEGCTGGGTGMTCHGFKAGTGSASRRIPIPNDFKPLQQNQDHWTLGALVQANYGAMEALRIGGVSVGLKLAKDRKEGGGLKGLPYPTEPFTAGSIIIILATDAPLGPLQLQRLAQRATVGLARVGGNGNNYSGDVFLAFSTATAIPPFRNARGEARPNLPQTLLDEDMNGLFEAAADAVEESIYNSLCMAETTIGPVGRRAEALDLDEVRKLVEPRLL